MTHFRVLPPRPLLFPLYYEDVADDFDFAPQYYCVEPPVFIQVLHISKLILLFMYTFVCMCVHVGVYTCGAEDKVVIP